MTKQSDPTHRHAHVPPLTLHNIVLLHVHKKPPVLRLVAELSGDDAEQRANDRLHDLSLLVPPGSGPAQIRVVFVFSNNLRLVTTHRVGYLSTDGSVRDHLRRDLHTYLKHEHHRPAGFTKDLLLSLYRRLRPERSEHYARKRLQTMSRNPPVLPSATPMEQEGYTEFIAALVDALRCGADTHETIQRARSMALELAPHGPGACAYEAGIWWGISAARDAVNGCPAGKPPSSP